MCRGTEADGSFRAGAAEVVAQRHGGPSPKLPGAGMRPAGPVARPDALHARTPLTAKKCTTSARLERETERVSLPRIHLTVGDPDVHGLRQIVAERRGGVQPGGIVLGDQACLLTTDADNHHAFAALEGYFVHLRDRALRPRR